MSKSLPDEEFPIELLPLAEKLLSQPIKNGLITYCPSMDLLAMATTDEHVQILRLNGQKVVSIPSRKDCSVMKLCWKPNGSLLAIAYSDNTLSLIATQGGKTVHQIQCPIPETTMISALGWAVSFADVPAVQALVSPDPYTDLDNDPAESSQKLTLDDVLHRGFIGEIAQPRVDLPSDLASLDVESILPKLSVLPPGGKEGDVFTSRTSIDALFHSKDTKSGSADVLIVGFEDGSAWLAVHDFFELGRFDSKQVAPDKMLSIVRHTYHPYFSTQGLILRRTAQDQDQLYFAPLDLPLIGENGRQFSLLASQSTQLLNVLRYVRECQLQVYSEFTASQTLSQRFIANVEEDLQEKEQTTFKTAAYHLVATGDCSPVVKEWLVDQIGDRGQKRWEKGAISGYENTRRLLHENLLPALDRANVLLNRLKGYSLFHETANAFGLSVQDIDHALDTLKCLHLVGHSALIASDTELRQSSAFCAWLKQEIDTQVTDSAPTSTDETEKEPNFDYVEIFEYIEGPLRNSLLYEFFDLKHASDSRETVEMPSELDNMYDSYKAALQKVRSGQHLPKRLPGVAALIERLQKQCSTIFGNIADTQQKKVHFGEPIPIGPCHADGLDMRMIPSESGDRVLSYVAALSPDRTKARVLRMGLSTSKGFSKTADLQQAIISALPDGQIFDIKFLDSRRLCIGLRQGKDGNKYCLLMIPYHCEDSALKYSSPSRRQSTSQDELDLSRDSIQGGFRRHMFGTAKVPSSTPSKIEVNGRKGRRAICIVSEDGSRYRVYDMDLRAEVIEAGVSGAMYSYGHSRDTVMED